MAARQQRFFIVLGTWMVAILPARGQDLDLASFPLLTQMPARAPQTVATAESELPPLSLPAKRIAEMHPVSPGDAKPIPSAIVEPSPPSSRVPPGPWHGPGLLDETGAMHLDEAFYWLAVPAPAFIDQALPMHVFRTRFDAFWGMNRPDRAEFFYPEPSFLQNLGDRDLRGPGLREARGPRRRERNVDAQELSFYVEVLLAPHVSLFTDVPFRFINPDINNNEAGLSDVSLGFKFALIMEPTRVLSFQIRGTAPTGEGFRGLGTENWAVEPGLLYHETFGDFGVFGEVRDRIPIDPRSSFAGNVLRYGVGANYTVADVGGVQVIPTVEGIGWTVLSGKETANIGSFEPIVQNSRGTTSLTWTAGVRLAPSNVFGDGGYLALSDLYVGYGHTFTRDRWYRDIIRIEYRLRF
jgi:hypothetical protein